MKTIRMLALLLFGGLLASAAVAQPADAEDRLVSVSGEGVVRVEPDMAVVRFGIVTQAQDPEVARRENAEAAREAMNAVRALGVPERNIQLEVLRLQPNREYDPDTRRYIDRGYEAVRQVVVKLHDLEQLPSLIAQVIQKGANRLESVTYDLQNRDVVRDQALKEAVLHARAKAVLIASTLDEEIGRVRRVDEQQFDFPRPVMYMAAEQASMAKDAAAPEPEAYAAGEIEVRAQVQAVFELK